MKLEEKIAEIVECILDDTAIADQSEWLAKRIAQSLSSLCVGVKELEWSRNAGGTLWADVEPGNAWMRATVIGDIPGIGYAVRVSENRIGAWATEEEAIAAAEAEVRRRIISCLNIRTEEEVRREYLEELVAEADDECAEITDSSPGRMREALGAACWLRRSLQQEGKSDA